MDSRVDSLVDGLTALYLELESRLDDSELSGRLRRSHALLAAAHLPMDRAEELFDASLNDETPDWGARLARAVALAALLVRQEKTRDGLELLGQAFSRAARQVSDDP